MARLGWDRFIFSVGNCIVQDRFEDMLVHVKVAMWRLEFFFNSWGEYRDQRVNLTRKYWLKARTKSLVDHDQILCGELVARRAKKKGA